MSCKREDIDIWQGKSLRRIVRWEAFPLVWKAVTAITQAAPPAITATGHGVPDGWPAAVVSAGGMRQINSKHNPPRDNEFRPATVVDANTVTFNDISSLGFSEYTEGGALVYYTPVDLDGYTARLIIKDRIGGDVLVTLTTENDGITLDNTAKTITISMTAEDTAELDWTEGVYELEMESGTGFVTGLLAGSVFVREEVATA